MSGEDNSSGAVESSCALDVYDSPEYKAVAAVRIVTGLISFICCLSIVTYMVYYKKYRFILNLKLVLFLAISAALHSFSFLVGRINFYTDRPIIDYYCLFAGSVELYTSWTEIIAILCISHNLLSAVTCNPNTKNMERIYLSLIFILPVLWCWVPILFFTYGTAGPWCGIRIFTVDCDPFPFGLSLRYLLEDIPLAVVFVATIIFSVATWVILKRKIRRLQTAYRTSPTTTVDTKQLVKELKHLLWYPPVYAIFQVFLLVNQVYESIHPQQPIFALWLLQVLTTPLAGAVIALVCALNSEINLLSRARVWCNRKCCQRSKEERPRTVTEYECDRYVKYGDSVEGTQNMMREARIKQNSAIIDRVQA